MSNIEEYKRYIKKQEMLGNKIFKFREDRGCIRLGMGSYIENNETERLITIPDFVEDISGSFMGVKQGLVIRGGRLKKIEFIEYGGEKLDLRGLNTKEINSMSDMFFGCENLKELNIDGFDTSKVTSMENMFYRCAGLREINLSGFNTSNVVSMEAMFSSCVNLKEIDLSNFDTRQVVNARNMFSNCDKLEKLKVDNFDTRNIKSMHKMFYGCDNLKELDLSNFDIRNIKNMEYMFKDCIQLERIDMSNFSAGVEYRRGMFECCDKLKLIITNREHKRWLEEHRGWTNLNKSCEIKVRE